MTWTTSCDRDPPGVADSVAFAASLGSSCATWTAFGATIFAAAEDCECVAEKDSTSAAIDPSAGRDHAPASGVCGAPWICYGCGVPWSVVSAGGDLHSVEDCDLSIVGGDRDRGIASTSVPVVPEVEIRPLVSPLPRPRRQATQRMRSLG
uniref:(northern house mosquito) hypothetical protein n=1 Tax=Culex pipiens TaxID=7175 RepID=A0A8D8GCF6_CULPI